MSCITCGGPSNPTGEGQKVEWKDGICDVHRLLKKDTTMRQVTYCETCDANICIECYNRYDLRIASAVVSRLREIFKIK